MASKMAEADKGPLNIRLNQISIVFNRFCFLVIVFSFVLYTTSHEVQWVGHALSMLSFYKAV